ncbi:MAG: hypothetical protein AAGK78_14900, partial [Planctomycetota bacterium]
LAATDDSWNDLLDLEDETANETGSAEVAGHVTATDEAEPIELATEDLPSDASFEQALTDLHDEPDTDLVEADAPDEAAEDPAADEVEQETYETVEAADDATVDTAADTPSDTLADTPVEAEAQTSEDGGWPDWAENAEPAGAFLGNLKPLPPTQQTAESDVEDSDINAVGEAVEDGADEAPPVLEPLDDAIDEAAPVAADDKEEFEVLPDAVADHTSELVADPSAASTEESADDDQPKPTRVGFGGEPADVDEIDEDQQ